MVTTTQTPNMNLVLPNVGQELEPQASTDNNTAFELIDVHNHAAGNGVRIPAAGINIDQDFSLNQFNLKDARAVKLKNNISLLSDIDAFYEKSGDIWWNNHTGVPVQITSGSSLNTGVASTVFSEVVKSAAYTILVGDTWTLILVDCSSAPVSVNLPVAANVSAGRYYIVKDAKANASINNITLVPNGADTIDTVASNKILNVNSESLWLAGDGVSNWNSIGGAVPATAVVAGIVRLSQDLGGTSANPLVVGANGASIPAGGSLTTGNSLRVSGPAALTYSSLNLAGGANYVTGLLPSANYNADTLTGHGGTINCASPIIAGTGFRLGSVAISGIYSVDPGDTVLSCNTSGGAVTLSLPATTYAGMVLDIIDVSGMAHTNNISLIPNGSHTIDGLNVTRILSADYGHWRFICSSSNNWYRI